MLTITARCVSREVRTSCWSLIASTVKKSSNSPTAGTRSGLRDEKPWIVATLNRREMKSRRRKATASQPGTSEVMAQ
ncbi:hypothetical protein D3C80_1820760 [compost metagenome]